jgi:DNA-directed RNA polymerase subunit H
VTAEETKRTFLDHEMIPKHMILTEEERKVLLQKYNIQAEWLPLVKASDPVVHAIGGKPGDIVKIMRKSATAGEYAVFYRLVIKG